MGDLRDVTNSINRRDQAPACKNINQRRCLLLIHLKAVANNAFVIIASALIDGA